MRGSKYDRKIISNLKDNEKKIENLTEKTNL